MANGEDEGFVGFVKSDKISSKQSTYFLGTKI